MSRPWMPLYVSDYLADTRHLSLAEHGAYLMLIMHYWQKGGLPDDDDKLARIVGVTPKKWKLFKPLLGEFFSDGWIHKRIDDEIKKSRQASERRALSGKAGGLAKASNARAMLEQCSNNAVASTSTYIDSSLRSESILSKISNDIFSSSAGPDDGALSARKPEKANGHAERELILDMVDIWNTEALAMGLPAVRNITATRQSALKARVADFAEDGIAPQDGMRELMAKIRGSPFLRGTTKEGFRATFDFAMKSSTFHRIMEGSYAPKGT